jgi:hypothetical protein
MRSVPSEGDDDWPARVFQKSLRTSPVANRLKEKNIVLNSASAEAIPYT